ncbi:MAG: polysaccharide deacetylase family protein, partial [Chthoniobacterales bacterium]
MVIRFAVLSLVLALNFPGCKKSPEVAANNKPGLNSSPAPAVAVAPTPAPTPIAPPIDQNAQVVIFGYHRFEKTVRRPDTEMTPEMFEAQMKELKDKNIPVIGMQDFLAWKRGEKNIPPRSAVITFDDGWKTQYEVGWPIMKKYGYPFTLFIYTEGVKGGKFGGGAAMSWEQLAEMRDAG